MTSFRNSTLRWMANEQKIKKKMETAMPDSHVNNFNLLECLMDQYVILKAYWVLGNSGCELLGSSTDWGIGNNCDYCWIKAL